MELKKKKANKEHNCTNCKKKINKGENYFCEERFLAELKKDQVKICMSCYKK